ncbi:MAG: hypothetical protein QHI38_11345 [Armatimonadota bacterium]|nr:hypothetical protein [Armatimonadota bacterium]
MLIIVAAIIFVVAGRSKPLPTGEAAGVDIPPAKIPKSATPINPYKVQPKPAPNKPGEAPTSGGQSWGP